MELKQFFSWKTFILTLLCGVFAGLNSATYADTLNDIISSLFNLVQNELIINSGISQAKQSYQMGKVLPF